MTYRIDEIEVPVSEPFLNDQLNRSDSVMFLAELIERTGGPFVLAIDAPWGNGKTTFVKMLKAILESKEFRCIYFNAWEVDYVTDPLVALVSTVVELKLEYPDTENIYLENLNSLRKITSLLAKRGTVSLVKALTPGGVDLEDEISRAKDQFAQDPLSDIIDSFLKESNLLSTFRSQLEAIVSNLSNERNGKPLIFFVDELDRCRPSFSIEMLERVKHLFSVPNILFVFSIDMSQLEASTAAVYGSKINAPEYLRRFFDIEFGLPASKGEDFTSSLLNKFKMEDFFAGRGREHDGDMREFIEAFSKLVDVCELTLRIQERCMTRLKIVLDQTPQNQNLDPIMVALLIILRAINSPLYATIHIGELTFKKVRDYLSEFPKGKDFLEDDIGIMLEAHFIWMDSNQIRFEEKLNEINIQKESIQLAGATNSEHTHFRTLVSYLGHMMNGRYQRSNMSYIARKIDIATNIT